MRGAGILGRRYRRWGGIFEVVFGLILVCAWPSPEANANNDRAYDRSKYAYDIEAEPVDVGTARIDANPGRSVGAGDVGYDYDRGGWEYDAPVSSSTNAAYDAPFRDGWTRRVHVPETQRARGPPVVGPRGANGTWESGPRAPPYGYGGGSYGYDGRSTNAPGTGGPGAVEHVNPRELFPTQTLRETTSTGVERIRRSIREDGFVHNTDAPVQVARDGDRLIVIDGHHRQRAAILEGLDEIPVEIVDVSPGELERLRELSGEAEFWWEAYFSTRGRNWRGGPND